MNIGKIKIESNLSLGPMAGVTDAAFRKIAREFGLELSYTEMVSAKALAYGDHKTKQLLKREPFDQPIGVQLFGSDVEAMVKAAKIIEEEYDFDFIDINMGCPTPKIVKNGDGSALMKTPALAGKIIEELKRVTSKPVTAKIRTGWDEDHLNAVSFAKVLALAGADLITVHGRTRAQQYTGQADWEIIGAVKQAVEVPVVGNGDIFTLEDLLHYEQTYHVDGYMVARGAQGNPWLIQDIVSYMKTGETRTASPSILERIEVIKRHLAYAISYKGERRGILEMRKHAAWYTKTVPGAAKFRSRLTQAGSKEAFYAYLDEMLDKSDKLI